MPAVPVALAASALAPAAELTRAVAVKPHAPLSRPRMSGWHPPSTRKPKASQVGASDSGRQDYTRPYDSPRRDQDEHTST